MAFADRSWVIVLSRLIISAVFRRFLRILGWKVSKFTSKVSKFTSEVRTGYLMSEVH